MISRTMPVWPATPMCSPTSSVWSWLRCPVAMIWSPRRSSYKYTRAQISETDDPRWGNRLRYRLPERVDLRAVEGAEADAEPAGSGCLRSVVPMSEFPQLRVRIAGLCPQEAQDRAVLCSSTYAK